MLTCRVCRKRSQITTANKQTACCPSQPQCRQVSAARTRDTSGTAAFSADGRGLRYEAKSEVLGTLAGGGHDPASCELPALSAKTFLSRPRPRPRLYSLPSRRLETKTVVSRTTSLGCCACCSFAEAMVLVHFVVLALMWLTREPDIFPGWLSLVPKK